MSDPAVAPAAGQPPRRKVPYALVVAIVVIVVASIGIIRDNHLFGAGSSDESSMIASKIGGSCRETRYYIKDRLDGHKSTIYDCTTPAKGEMCVTYDGGIATDSTDEVKLLFENTLGSSKPGCAT